MVTDLPEPVCFLGTLLRSQDRLVRNLLQGCSDQTHHVQRDGMRDAVKARQFLYVHSPSLRYGSRTSRLSTLHFGDGEQTD